MESNYISLLGSYYGLVGIVFAYCLFVLQFWIQKCADRKKDADDIVERTASGDIERTKMKKRIEIDLKSFPLFQVMIIIISSGLISALIAIISLKITTIPFVLDGLPAVMVFILLVIASVVGKIKGRQLLSEGLKALSD